MHATRAGVPCLCANRAGLRDGSCRVTHGMVTFAPLALDLVPHGAAGDVVVHQAARLHQGVRGRRADEAEAVRASAPSRAPSTRASTRGGRRASAAPAAHRRGTTTRAPGTRRRRRAARPRRARSRSPLDLRAVADDRRVAHQPLDVARRRTAPPRPGRTRRTRRGSPRAWRGSSPTRAPTGTPRGRASRTARARP